MSDRAEGDAGSGNSDSQMQDLRELLLGPQQRQLAELQARLDAMSFSAQAVSRVLPEAITLRTKEPGEQLTQALVPVVEGALLSSVQKDRERIADLLYPVMGPAIRKSIAESMASLVQSLNQALEHSLSVRGILWRLEAARTGVSFAEVVLRHNLLYRVEQVFLIHKQTGLPLQHVVAEEVVAQDSSLVSGMLTALQDFVRDSFTSQKGEGIDMLKVGDLNVWIEQGPSAILAAVIRGNAPESLRTALRSALETVHLRYAHVLSSFDGDDSGFAEAQPVLAACMTKQYKPRQSRPSVALILLILIPLVSGGYFLQRWWKETSRWESYVARLRAAHGIVVHDYGKKSGHYYLHGLRDPLAVDPWRLLADSGIKRTEVQLSFEEYQGMFPEFLEARARTMLAPPPTVSLALRGHNLWAKGQAPHRWLVAARRLATVIAGVQTYDDSEVQDTDVATVAESRAAITKTILVFHPGVSALQASDNTALLALAQQMLRLLSAALVLDSIVQIHVIGQSDDHGADNVNLNLSRQRAETVAAALRDHGVPYAILIPMGIGAPERTADSSVDSGSERRVAFRVELFSPAVPRSAAP